MAHLVELVMGVWGHNMTYTSSCTVIQWQWPAGMTLFWDWWFSNEGKKNIFYSFFFLGKTKLDSQNQNTNLISNNILVWTFCRDNSKIGSKMSNDSNFKKKRKKSNDHSLTSSSVKIIKMNSSTQKS